MVTETHVTINSVGAAGPPGPQGVQGPVGPKGDPGGFTYSTGIAEGTDLNSVTVPGLYMRSSSVGNTLALNYPLDGWAGTLEVVSQSANGSLVQRATSISSAQGSSGIFNSVYYRTRFGGTWQPWQRLNQTVSGTGLPEGVVTAPVGTKYIDTAATNGAVEWIKAVGTSNTGWKVVYGDTGWRRFYIAADPATGNEYTGSINLRRVNQKVYLRFQTAVPTPGSGYAYFFGPGTTNGVIPQGFRVTDSQYGFVRKSNNAIVPERISLFSGTTVIWAGTGMNSGGTRPTEGLIGEIEWLVRDETDPWPTTLPGTAA